MTALDDLLVLLDIEALEVNLFRGVSPVADHQRVFGGQVAAQALVAAGRTVEPDRHVNSLHSYFLSPGDTTVPIIFEVDRPKDGRTFTTRRVNAIQHGRVIFNLSASFQIDEPGPEHVDAMPEVPEPETLPTWQERMRAYADQFSPDVVAWMVRERPIDSRPTELPPWIDHRAREPEQDVWIRANGDLPDDPLLHACVVAYASDLSLLDTAMLPHATRLAHTEFQIASLDHAMWFHRPFRADTWLLYHQTSPFAGGARGLAQGAIYTRAGKRAVTVIQEGLIRPVTKPKG